MASDKSPLQKIAEIEIAGEKFDLAKNGTCCLVTTVIDAYGQPKGEAVDLEKWLFTGTAKQAQTRQEEIIAKVDALLNLLGDAYSRLRQQKDARLGTGAQQ